MKKTLLFLVLLILFLSFSVFFYKVYLEQKKYFDSKEIETPAPVSNYVETGIPSKYIDYSKENYDNAILDKRPLLLFFTSNWCTLCFDQDSVNKDVLLSLNKEGVTGLKVHILDSETTTETGALAKKFDVTKENSIVILDKDGAVKFKYIGNLEGEILKTKILESR